MSLMLLLLMIAQADAAAPPAPGPGPVKIEAVRRSGYALVSAAATGEKPLKQVEWIVISGASTEITYDQVGSALIVTLPPAGTVQVFCVALLSDSSLAAPVSVELSAASPGSPTPSPPTPAAPPTAGARVIAVFDFGKLTEPEKALLNSQVLKEGLAKIGMRYLYADLGSSSFQATLAAAKKVAPNVPDIAPFLFVETADRKFTAAYKLTLSPDTKKNEQEILGLFAGQK
jgi:hypothetical protein